GDRRRPAVDLLDQGVVRVAAPDTLRGVELVVPGGLDPRDALDDVDELVDADQLVAAQVDRLVAVAGEDHLGSLDAVVDVHERAGLLAVAPDLDVVVTGDRGGRDLAADR